MSNINKQALRQTAEKTISEEGETWWNEEQLASDYGLALHRSDAKFIAAANPAAVLALLDELEAAQNYAKERDEENQDLMLTVGRLRVERETSEAEMGNALCQLLSGCHYMDPPDGGNVTPLEQVRRMVADYRERIAELESREVALPDYTEVYQDEFAKEVEHQVRVALKSAGISIKGE